MPGPLAGLRVLDLSRVLAGPWASQLLADFGAEVIKIEKPDGGDDTRSWGPPFLKDCEGRETGESAYFLAANRGKKSVVVDIASKAGQAAVKALAARSDIFLENFKTGTLQKYGLDYESLAAINPRLIYCSITGFGHTGPDNARAGYDYLIQAMSGLMSITGEPDREPVKVGVAVTDILTGLYAASAILSALHYRTQTGLGQHIDLALYDVQLAALANQAANYLVSGTSPTRLGNAHPSICPYQVFKASDDYFVLAVGNDAQFARFCAAAGCAPLASDSRFSSNSARVANREELTRLLSDLLAGRPARDWIAALSEAGVPCGPIASIAEAFSHSQAQARGMAVTMPHPLSGTVILPGNPVKFSKTPVHYKSPPPLLGQHTDEVLRSIEAID
jgi:crotonobetainyl-CoA:carnitine CoA-transferase CaiB-like acyl-CoA transferase